MKSTISFFLLLALAFAPALTRSDMPEWAACMAACQASMVVCFKTFALRGTSRSQPS